MDNRITKSRLNDHISYDWWKYPAIVLGVILFLSLIFTMTSAKLKPGEKMELFFLGDEYTKMSQEEISAFDGKLAAGGYLTSAVLETDSSYYDVSDSTMQTVVSTRTGAGDGDILFASYFKALVSYVDGYDSSAVSLGEVLDQADALVEYFYDESGKQSFQQDFKSYKDEEALKEAMDAENERIREYRAQAAKLRNYLTEYPELQFNYRQNAAYNEYCEMTGEGDEYELGEEKLWALNCSPMINKMKGKLIYWVNEDPDEELAEAQKKAKFDTYLMILMPRDRTVTYFLECISVFNCMIETYYDVDIS